MVHAVKHLKKEMRSKVQEGGSSWRNRAKSFRPDTGLGIGPGILNLSPAWYESGHEDQVCNSLRYNIYYYLSMNTVEIPAISPQDIPGSRIAQERSPLPCQDGRHSCPGFRDTSNHSTHPLQLRYGCVQTSYRQRPQQGRRFEVMG